MDLQIIEMLSPMLVAHPRLALLVMIVGALRLALKPAMAILESYVKSTETTEDDEALERIEHSRAFSAVCWFLNLFASVKIGPEAKK